MTDPRFEAMDDDELIAYLRSRAGERHRDTSWPAVAEITERFARLREQTLPAPELAGEGQLQDDTDWEGQYRDP